MLRLKRPRSSVVTLLGFSFAIILGCGDNAGSGAATHGAITGIGDGRASTIQITPSSTTVEEGAIAPLSCLALDSRGVVVTSSRSWTISDPTIATLGANGTVAGQRAGNAIATCTVDGKTATAAVTVTPSPVALVEVTPGAGVLVIGKSIQLVATPLDSNGKVVPNHQVQWVTPDSGVAAVTSSGDVIGRVEGSANIIATSGGKAAFAKINVAKQPPSPVASISISLDDASLNVGQLAHATATTVDATGQVVTGRSITWSVTDPSVISAVSTSGNKANVTGRGQGTTTLTATSEGKSTSVSVIVAMAPVQAVVVNLASTSILPGQTTQATATLTDALGNVLTGRTVTWSSLDPSIATVSAVGVVTGVTSGAVIIRATSEGQAGDGTETVGVAPVATVSVNLGSSALSAGQTTQASAVARDAYGNVLTGRSVAWSSLNTSVATVSITGVVTAVAAGSATIRATVETKIGDASMTVGTPVPVATVSASLNATSLSPGQTTQAVALARDASGNLLTGRSVAWSSLNPGVATVSSGGVVTAVAAGSATIRATVETKTGDVGLTVTAAVQGTTASVVVTLDSTTLAIGNSSQARVVAKDAQGNVLSGKTVSWSSSNTAIATVSSTGVAKGVNAGTDAISATIDGVVGQAPLAVVVPTTLTAPAPGSGTYASSTFEDGTINPFYNPWGSGIDVINDPTGGGHGKAARSHYVTDAITQFDDNKALLPQNLSIGAGDSLWFQGDFYFPATDNMTASGPSTVQRKLLYWKNDYSPHPFVMVVTSFGPQMVINTIPTQSFSPTGENIYLPVNITTGVWHTLKVQLKPNTSFIAKDGTLRVWLDGVLVFDHTDMSWTDPTVWAGADLRTYQWTNFGVGYQVSSAVAVNEYRYWDNVTFSTAPIKP